MATLFESFLKQSKLDPRRIIAASEKLEKLRREDRATRLLKRQARKSEDANTKKLAAEAQKPRSGKPVTNRAIEAALVGKTLSGPAKTRILRAINHLLEQKKQEPVTLKALFDAPKAA
jgi:hypothetical protein